MPSHCTKFIHYGHDDVQWWKHQVQSKKKKFSFLIFCACSVSVTHLLSERNHFNCYCVKIKFSDLKLSEALLIRWAKHRGFVELSLENCQLTINLKTKLKVVYKCSASSQRQLIVKACPQSDVGQSERTFFDQSEATKNCTQNFKQLGVDVCENYLWKWMNAVLFTRETSILE